MTTLSPAEKQAGRAFRDGRQAALDALNRAKPPGVFVLPFWRVVRHECPAAGGRSVGITLRENYDQNPEYCSCACGCGEIRPLSFQEPVFPHRHTGAAMVVDARQFAFVWKEGKCSGAGCGLTARSKAGRFVLAADRPPDHGRTIERQAGPHSGDPRQPGA